MKNHCLDLNRRAFLALLASVPLAARLRIRHDHRVIWYPQQHMWGCPECRRLITVEELTDRRMLHGAVFQR